MMHFLAMGGYADYVWPAYGVSVIGIGSAIAITWRGYARAKAALDRIERENLP